MEVLQHAEDLTARLLHLARQIRRREVEQTELRVEVLLAEGLPLMKADAWDPCISDISPFSREKLDELQKAVGIRLPDDYIADLEAHSGMVRKASAVQVRSRRTGVGSLLYVGGEHRQHNYTYSIENSLERLAEWADGFDEVEGIAFWPVAKDLLQGVFCLRAKAGSGDAPEVVLVDRELDPDEEHAVIPLADSYAEFMASLEVE